QQRNREPLLRYTPLRIGTLSGTLMTPTKPNVYRPWYNGTLIYPLAPGCPSWPPAERNAENCQNLLGLLSCLFASVQKFVPVSVIRVAPLLAPLLIMGHSFFWLPRDLRCLCVRSPIA